MAILWIMEAGLVMNADRRAQVFSKKLIQAAMFIEKPELMTNLMKTQGLVGIHLSGLEHSLSNFKPLPMDALQTWFIIWIVVVVAVPTLCALLQCQYGLPPDGTRVVRRASNWYHPATHHNSVSDSDFVMAQRKSSIDLDRSDPMHTATLIHGLLDQ